MSFGFGKLGRYGAALTRKRDAWRANLEVFHREFT